MPIDRRGDGATHQGRPHTTRTYSSRVTSFSIMLLATVLMVFMASVNRALMSLLTSCWKPSITWQNTLFLMIVSTNSTRASAAKSFSSVEFERLSFGSEENEHRACVMLIWRGLSKKHRFSTKHDLRRARSRPHPSSDLCENLMDQISQVYIFCQKSFKSVTASAFELFSNHSMTHAQNPKKSVRTFYN